MGSPCGVEILYLDVEYLDLKIYRQTDERKPHREANTATTDRAPVRRADRQRDTSPNRPRLPVIQLTVSLHVAIRHPLAVRSNRFV